MISSMDIMKQKKLAYVEVIEQPAGKGLRFRYECEGRSAGSIPGATSTLDNRTFPTIKVHGYEGRAVVVVSCVTAEPPYRPHPHNLVGKEGCKKGVCTLELNGDMTCSFPSLGIQCVKKKDIEDSLGLRQQIRVDPFQTGFSHKTYSQNIDLNCVRLAFQVFLEGNERGAFTFALKPVVSDPIFDKKSKCDLTIVRLTETSGPVAGGKEILLFCEKINKDDIQVRFYEEEEGNLVWEAFGDFQPSDVHKQFGICFRTPKYKNIEIEQSVKVQLQLRRPSDGAVSESREFEFIPLDAGRAYWSAKRLKTNFSVFNQILSVEQATRNQQIAIGSQEELLRRKIPNPSHTNSMMGVSTTAQDQMLQALQQQTTSGMAVTAPVGPMGVVQAPLGQQKDDNKIQDLPNEGVGSSPLGYRHLRPVAMPGSSQGNKISLGLMQPPTSVQPPEVPVRSPNKSSLLQASLGLQHSTLPARGHQPPVPQAPRPLSDLSLMSDMTQCETASTCTRQSVNEILSLAAEDGSQFDLDNISINTFIQPIATTSGAVTSLHQINLNQVTSASNNNTIQRKMSTTSGVTSSGPTDYMGSLTSVATVREYRTSQGNISSAENMSKVGAEVIVVDDATDTSLQNQQVKDELMEGIELEDIGQIYDDVMNCVYDDVDMKYDDLTLDSNDPVQGQIKNEANEDGEPPVPPIRKRGLSVDRVIEKPLPVTPKNPSIITLITEKKNEMIREREREAEKRRQADAEKARRKMEEKERKRAEEEAKKSAKKQEEEERKSLAGGVNSPTDKDVTEGGEAKQSLFQRLFSRGGGHGKSEAAGGQSAEADRVEGQDQEAGTNDPCPEDTSLETPPPMTDLSPPPVPQHFSAGGSLPRQSQIKPTYTTESSNFASSMPSLNNNLQACTDNNTLSSNSNIPSTASIGSQVSNLAVTNCNISSFPVTAGNMNCLPAPNSNLNSLQATSCNMSSFPVNSSSVTSLTASPIGQNTMTSSSLLLEDPQVASSVNYSAVCSPQTPLELPPNFDTDLDDIEQIISSTTAQLQRLDNVVSEFTQQFPTQAQQQTTAAQ